MLQKNVNARGFTLLEMSISLIILGIVIATGFSLYTPYIETKKVETTHERLDRLYAALEEYKLDRGFYPCPAPLTTARGDATYGYAEHVSFPAAPHCSDTTVAPGDCSAGGEYCVKQSIRALPDQRVRVGAVPFRELNISERASYDGYKSKFYYAVTESMARDTNSFNLNNGAIDVVDSRGISLLDTPGSIKFVIFSAGKNQVGAYNHNGQLAVDCAAPYTGADIQNCSETTLNASFLSRAYNDESTANEMDDIISFDNSQINRSLHGWRLGNVANGEDADDALTRRSIKIGDFNASPRQQVDVSGANEDIRVEQRLIAETSICKNDDPLTPPPEDCFNVALLERSTCPAGQYVSAIGPTDDDGDGTIDSYFTCSPVLYQCEEGDMIIGVEPTLVGGVSNLRAGEPICAPVPPPPVGGGPGGPPPPTACGATRSTPTACTSGSGTYLVYQTYNCADSTWIYNSDTENVDCCAISATPDVDTWTNTLATLGNHEHICGYYGYGTRTRTRTLVPGTCSQSETNVRSCTCSVPGEGLSNPVGYNHNIHDITSCRVRNYTFGPGGGSKCNSRSPGTEVQPGSFASASGKLQIVGDPDNQDVLSPGTKQEGDSCTLGSSEVRCAATDPVSVGSSNYQYYNRCRCVKNPSPSACHCSGRPIDPSNYCP